MEHKQQYKSLQDLTPTAVHTRSCELWASCCQMTVPTGTCAMAIYPLQPSWWFWPASCTPVREAVITEIGTQIMVHIQTKDWILPASTFGITRNIHLHFHPRRGEVSAQNWQHFWENSCPSQLLAVRTHGNLPSSRALQGVKKQIPFHPPHSQRKYPLSFWILQLLPLILCNLSSDQFVTHSIRKCKKKVLGMRCFYPFRVQHWTGCESITRKRKLSQTSKCGLRNEMF